MLESPLIQELVAERAEELVATRTHELVAEGRQRDILAVIQTRFGEVPRDLAEEIESVVDDDQLTALVRKAVACPSLESLRNEIER